MDPDGRTSDASHQADAGAVEAYHDAEPQPVDGPPERVAEPKVGQPAGDSGEHIEDAEQAVQAAGYQVKERFGE